MRLDTHRDGLHAFAIARAWKEMSSGVDAAFSYADKLYMFKVGLAIEKRACFVPILSQPCRSNDRQSRIGPIGPFAKRHKWEDSHHTPKNKNKKKVELNLKTSYC